MGKFDERLRHFRALSRVYVQLKDGRGKDEYVYFHFIEIGSGDQKKRSIKCQSIYFISVLRARRWCISELDFVAKQYH